MDPTTELMTLLPDLRALIVCSLTRNAARTLASTCSAALRDVLEARSDIQGFLLHRTLVRSMAQLTFSAAGKPRSKARVKCRQGHVTFRVHMPLRAVPQMCAEQHCAGSSAPTDPALFWLSSAAIASATIVHAQADTTAAQPAFALSAGMVALAGITVQGCTLLPNWLPPSSCGNVSILRIFGSSVSLPDEMGSLVALYLRDCQPQAQEWPDAWLPVGSCASVLVLDISGCATMTHIPENMAALRYLNACQCNNLSADWLPESSGQSLRVLDLRRSSVSSIREGLGALEALHVTSCRNLAADWLPASSRQRVRLLFADMSNITCIPAMPALKALSLGYCGGLIADWLSADSRDSLQGLFLDRTAIDCVPQNLGALYSVWVQGCSGLTAGWLPASSSQRVTSVHAAGSNIESLPAGMRALSRLDARGCRNLALDWLPLSSAAIMHKLQANESSMQTLPEAAIALRAVLDTTPADPRQQLSFFQATTECVCSS
jgi:hypothetical protein